MQAGTASANTRAVWRGACLACSCLLLAGSATRGSRLTSEAFIWQLRWTPALSQTVAGDADLFARWHVLAATLPTDGVAVLAQVDWRAVTANGHPVVPVVRIEGRLEAGRISRTVADIAAVLDGLPGGVTGALEVDHDAATSRLEDYAAFLHALRAALPPAMSLSATALPTWLESSGFDAVAGAVDLLVLQVHAVDDPRLGLFRPSQALAAIRALAWRTDTPFLVALPAYGIRVAGQAGALTVAAEATVEDGRIGSEVAADPHAVTDVVAALRRDPPAGLRGFAWFRLPAPGDTRAWSDATLRHVVLGEPLQSRLAITARPGRVPGATDIVIANVGADDVMLPRRIDLPPGCSTADGLGLYAIDGGALARRGVGLLHAHARVLAGWMRCRGMSDGEGLHAEK